MSRRFALWFALLAPLGLSPVAGLQEETAEPPVEAAMVEAAAETAGGEERPTLAEILAKHREAMGGTAAWEAVESVRYSGSTTVGPGMMGPFTRTLKRPASIRFELDFQGSTAIQAFDGETAWMVTPFMERTDPMEMPPHLAEIIREQAEIDPPLFALAKRGHQAELLGVAELGGTRAYEIRLKRKDSVVEHHFLDRESFLPVRQERARDVQGRKLQIETTFGDYRELCVATSAPVDEETPCEGASVVIAFSIGNQAKRARGPVQAIVIERVELNPEGLTAGFFSMPAAAPAAAGTG